MAGESLKQKIRGVLELSQKLAPEEWMLVSLSIGISPEEIKAT